MNEHPFFHGFDAEQRATLIAGAFAFQSQADELLVREGQPADSFFLLGSGHVAIEINRSAKGPAHLQTLGSNEAVGWSWIVPPYRWEFDARALDPVAGLRFDAVWLRDFCERDAAIAMIIYRKLVAMMRDRLAAARLKLLELYA